MSDSIVALALGAGSTLAVTVVVQLWVVPLVDQRRRRDIQWEDDVRDLDELLNFRLAEAAVVLSRTLCLEVFISARRTDLPVSELIELRETQAARLDSARVDFARAVCQVRWLAERVTASGGDRSRFEGLDNALAELLDSWRAVDEASKREPQLFLAEARSVVDGMKAAVDRMGESVDRCLSVGAAGSRCSAEESADLQRVRESRIGPSGRWRLRPGHEPDGARTPGTGHTGYTQWCENGCLDPGRGLPGG